MQQDHQWKKHNNCSRTPLEHPIAAREGASTRGWAVDGREKDWDEEGKNMVRIRAAKRCVRNDSSSKFKCTICSICSQVITEQVEVKAGQSCSPYSSISIYICWANIFPECLKRASLFICILRHPLPAPKFVGQLMCRNKSQIACGELSLYPAMLKGNSFYPF